MARLIAAGFGVATGCFLALSLLRAQTPQRQDAAGWPMYNGDLAGTRFSPLH